MNTKLRQKAKNNFKLMNNAFLRKPIENLRDIKHFITDRRSSYSVSESNYHTIKFFTEHLLAIGMNKTEILMNIRCILDFQY